MFDKNLLNKAGISYEAGMKRFMNDAALYEAVLSAFLGESVLEHAEAAYAANDCARLYAVIHESKGSGGNAGLDSIYAEACALAALLRSPFFSEDELAAQYARFVDAYTAARDGVQTALVQ